MYAWIKHGRFLTSDQLERPEETRQSAAEDNNDSQQNPAWLGQDGESQESNADHWAHEQEKYCEHLP